MTKGCKAGRNQKTSPRQGTAPPVTSWEGTTSTARGSSRPDAAARAHRTACPAEPVEGPLSSRRRAAANMAPGAPAPSRSRQQLPRTKHCRETERARPTQIGPTGPRSGPRWAAGPAYTTPPPSPTSAASTPPPSSLHQSAATRAAPPPRREGPRPATCERVEEVRRRRRHPGLARRSLPTAATGEGERGGLGRRGWRRRSRRPRGGERSARGRGDATGRREGGAAARGRRGEVGEGEVAPAAGGGADAGACARVAGFSPR